jgi:hypothetical protein
MLLCRMQSIARLGLDRRLVLLEGRVDELLLLYLCPD